MGLGIGGFAVVLVVAGAIAVGVENARRSPDLVVRQYVAHLAAGEAAAAGAMVDPGVPNAQRVLLDDVVLSSATSRLVLVDTTVDRRDAESAAVTATVSLDGERFSHRFIVDKGPEEYFFLDTWQLKQPWTVPVTLSSDSLPVVIVGDTPVTLASPGTGVVRNTADLYAYPGRYPVRAGGSGTYVTSRDQVLAARPDSPAAVRLDATPTEQLKAYVLDRAIAKVRSCAGVPGNMDPGCPYGVRDPALASLRVAAQPKGFDAFDLTGFTTTSAVITTTADPQPWDPDPQPRANTFRLHGTLTLDGDAEPAVTFSYAG